MKAFAGYGAAALRLREDRKRTQEDVAAAAGISVGTVQNIENEKGSPLLAKLDAILGALGLLLIFAISDKRPKCPECKSTIERGARRCAKCGSEIRVASVAG